MRKNLVILLGILFVFLVAGCTSDSNQSTGTPAQKEATQTTGEGGSTATPETESSAPTQESQSTLGDTAGEANTDEGTQEPVGDVIGTQAEPTGEAIPEDIIGTWTVVDGIPEGLSSYTLTINPDGTTVQTTVDASGVSNDSPSLTIIPVENGYAIVDPNNYVVLDLQYDGTSLTTSSLTGQPVVFSKS